MVSIKYILVLLLLLLFMPFAFAVDLAYVNEDTTVWCSITEDGLPLSVTSANISIYNPSGLLFVSDNPVLFSNGVYSYEFRPNVIGNWIMFCDFYTGSNLTGVATQTVIVKNEELVNMETFTMLVVFGIGALLLFLGGFIGYSLFYYGAGVWFVINSFYALNTLNTFSNAGFIFFMLLGIGVLLFALDDTRRGYKQAKRLEIDD